MCTVIILLLVKPPQASAAVNTYDHNALSEYEGYGQAMYETIVEQTTFVTGQYTDNKQYVKDSITQIKDYANFWLNEQGNLNNACGGTQIFTKNCLGELASSAGGYALTVGDFIKNLFSDANESEVIAKPPVYNGVITTSKDSFYFAVPDGYYMVFNHTTSPKKVNTAGATIHYESGKVFLSVSGAESQRLPTTKERLYETLYNNFKSSDNASTLLSLLAYFDITVTVKRENESPINPNFDRLNRYVQESSPKIIAPQPKAYLNCPDGTRIDMAINGSTFLDASGQVMNVNKNGTAQVSSQICNLGWEKPKVDYVDDKPAITDKDGNWLDGITGELLQCVLLDNCVPSKPDDKDKDDKNEIEPIDNSLVEYVKNAYEYATGVLKTATDGLKSLGTGAKELTALFGVFFSWLPREMVVLMSSGLALMIGLRLFRK